MVNVTNEYFNTILKNTVFKYLYIKPSWIVLSIKNSSTESILTHQSLSQYLPLIS